MYKYKQKRQHPAMIFLGAVNSFKYAFFPLTLAFISRLTEAEVLRAAGVFLGSLAGFFILSVAFHIPQWSFYTYRLEEGYLHIKSGVIFKKERSIKRERVQTVNINTGILQRLLGLATLEVETAGEGEQSELKLNAVTLEEARHIKGELESSEDLPLQGNDGPDTLVHKTEKTAKTHKKPYVEMDSWDSEEEREKEYRLAFPELLLAGATSGGFLLIFPIITAAFSQLFPLVSDTFWEYILEQIASTTTLAVVLVVIALLIVSWLISTIGFVIKYANFTLRRQGDRLLISWGFIEQKQLALKLHRLQSLVVQEGIMRQPFRRCSLNVEIAGGSSKDDQYVTILYPLLGCGKLPEFLRQILPEYYISESLVSLPERSKRRYIIRAVLPVLAVMLPAQLLPLPYLWLGFLMMVPAGLLGYFRHAAGGTSIDNGQLALRYRSIDRYRVLIQRKHIQSLEISSNPLQKMRNLRTVKASVLSSPQGKSFQVSDVDYQEASQIWEWYSRHPKS